MSGSSHTPIGSVDRSILIGIDRRLRTASYVGETYVSPKRGTATLTATVSPECFVKHVADAYLDVRWYTSGDFEIHYQENWTDGQEWKRRWDRHPREGSRDHYHPPPDAGRPPEAASYPETYHEMMRMVERETIEHLRNHPLLERAV